MYWKIKKITAMDGGKADEAALLESIKHMATTEPALNPLCKDDKLDFSSEAFREMFRAFREEPEKHAKANGYRNDGMAMGVSAIQIGDMDDAQAWVSMAHGPTSTLMTIADYITVEIDTDEEWNRDFERSTLFMFK